MTLLRLHGWKLLGVIALLGGCASAVNWPTPAPIPHTAAPEIPQTHSTRVGDLAAQAAAAEVGAPYHYGGASPRGFDCSGLVYFAYEQAGVQVPRTTRGLYRDAQPIALDTLRPGDLLFFYFHHKVAHVAIYAGDHRFVHAPSTGKSVMWGTLDDRFWRERLVSAGRLIL